MAFWRFTGTTAEAFPTLGGLIAKPGHVYDFGTATPPAEPLVREGVATSPANRWSSATGPATDFALLTAQASDVGYIHPSGDTTGATDTATIQAAIDTAANTANVCDRLVQLRARGQFFVNGTIQVKYPVIFNGNGATIKAVNASNLDAVIASPAALTTGAGVNYDGPITVQNVIVDGNRSGQTSGKGFGILLSAGANTTTQGGVRIIDNIVRETRGPGICLSEVNLGGNGLATNATASYTGESLIARNRVYSAGGVGIWQRGGGLGGAAAMTDGFMLDNIVGYCTHDGIRVDSAGGWVVDSSHVYGAGLSGVLLSGAYSTRVSNSYIEGVGVLDTVAQLGTSSAFSAAAAYNAGTTYGYGDVAVSGGTIYRSLVDVNIGNTPASSPTQWGAYAGGGIVGGVLALSSQSARPLVIHSNQISLGHASWILNANFSYVGIWGQGPASGTSKATVVTVANDIANELQPAGTNTTTVKFSGTGAGPSGVTPVERDNTTRGNWNSTRSADSTSAPVGNVGAGASGGTGSSITITGNNQCGTVTVVSGSSGLVAGALATATYTGTLNPAPRIALIPRDAPSSALGPLYATTSTTAFTINTSVAPGVNATYKYDYIAMVGA